MQPTRNIQSYPDTAGRGQLCSIRMPLLPLSVALLCAGFAGIHLAPAAAQGAAQACREVKQQRIPVRSGQKAKPRNDAATDGKKGKTETRQASAKTKASLAPPATDSKSAPSQAPSGKTCPDI